ncbi:hypothetical protein DVR12_27215 [Chitinophaga silvatica]|uniref:Bacterial surface antigen (D15) domain-containing protein n=1 Tax=Chitinophaga silvatica TaxID=2282649 RepID=A0A3E1Y281_9BACT|nr:BamA/TamA family outer membrane protein [Chitinophaga silvatica]RFS18736.1 hypothetical protein DVR12_27215 [Chitinophaga silvatica]
MIRSTLLTLVFCWPFILNARQQPGDTTAPPPPKGLINRVIFYLKHTHEEKKHKRFDCSIIGGPYYAPETSLGIVLMAAAQYKTQPHDSLLGMSNASIYGSASLTGFYGIGISSNTIFPKDKFRLFGKASFSSLPDKYWGIGYESADDKDNYTKYTLLTSKISADLSMKIVRLFYGGIGVSVSNNSASKVDTAAGHPVMPTKNVLGFGIGPFLIYDSRDFLFNAYRGIFARLAYKYFPSFLGNQSVFSAWELQFDSYLPVWNKCILATDVFAETKQGEVPWALMSLLGGANRLRGYYEGRFRDKSQVALQAELRQKVFGRNGVVAWIAAGNIFPELSQFALNQTLISYGIGYRWEFKRRINLRLDYGIGKDQSGFYFGINEVF